MATHVKRIEKDFYLKALLDEHIPIVYLSGKTQYIFTLDDLVDGQMVLKTEDHIQSIHTRSVLDLMFDYRGNIIIFTIEVTSFKDGCIVAEEPEFLYKNLDRTFSRIANPAELKLSFAFLGDRYLLSYPKVPEYEHIDQNDFINHTNLNDLTLLVVEMASWIKEHASSYKIVMFKDTKPSTTEERILAETGKALFIPDTNKPLPSEDPYPKKRIITEELFKRYLESIGVALQFLDDAYARFLRQKQKNGILSSLWMPILFQEYVIGYIHMWNETEGKPPFNFSMLDTLYQFSKVMAQSLKVSGYFESGKMKNSTFSGTIIDISASGLLFAYPNSPLTATLLPDSELLTSLVTPRRTIQTNAKIIRRFKDKAKSYIGCRFENMKPEDLRFIFEYIYSKRFTDSDVNFLTGHV